MDLTVQVKKRNKKHAKEDLQQLSNEELINKIVQLEAHNLQLKNIIQKNNLEKTTKKATDRNLRKFDFSKYHKRHILLRFYYLGWSYQGYAVQEDTIATIEHHIFNALSRVCLIESREASNYHRCGRTDKGVSAFHQVISLDIRSKIPKQDQLTEEGIKNELDYCKMMNRVLPEDIRCVAWMPMVNPNYSARFDCKRRTYRYFFPRGSLNIDAMQEACKHLIGAHDFRNLCKMDVGNGVVTFMRRIHGAGIVLSQQDESDKTYDMFYFELVGKAFLWHQVRCIMAILVLVGQGNEDPVVLKELLDVEKNPCKPQYSLANDAPLNLYECLYKFKGTFNQGDYVMDDGQQDEEVPEGDSDLREWVYDEENFARVITELQEQWASNNIKSTMMREMLNSLKGIYAEKFPGSDKVCNQANMLLQGVKAKEYLKLMERKKCESLENRIDHYAKKRRIEVTKITNGEKEEDAQDC